MMPLMPPLTPLPQPPLSPQTHIAPPTYLYMGGAMPLMGISRCVGYATVESLSRTSYLECLLIYSGTMCFILATVAMSS